MKVQFFSVLAIGFLAGFLPLTAQSQVRAWEGTMNLPTYEEGPPDPTPPFDAYQTTKFSYPYTLRENLTDNRAPHAWRALFLENKYLKCSILPDIGGHLYTCIDKLSGQSMFYENPSIKKANIGYRGAWAAFGIEFNFPVSHNWVSMSPVDFAYSQNKKDGSASVIVGNTDRVYGMSWSVELMLRPDSTVLEEHVTLYNRSDVRRRFYWWNNAGIQVWDDSKVEYPMRYVESHHFTEVAPWPMTRDGRNLSIIGQHTDGPVSFFVHGSREPFMGIWSPKTNTGTVHFADYSDLPGKKIWSWGGDADGLSWRKALSDNNSEYVEVQAGLFRNQETYSFLQPRATIRFNEYWMPVRQIGGISRANLAGVLNLKRTNQTLNVGFNANQSIQGASISITQNGQTLLQKNVDLVPEQTWSQEVHVADAASKCTFELRNVHGDVLLTQTEGDYDWTPVSEIHVGPKTDYPMPDTAKRSEDDWMQVGKEDELNGDNISALKAYQQGLDRFPTSFELRKAAGRLSTAMLRFDEAVPDLEAVHARNTADPEISYYLGIAYDGLGREADARNSFDAAWKVPLFRSAAGVRLAELRARQGSLTDADRFLSGALQAAPNDLRSAEELVAVRKAEGHTEEARTMAEEWLTRFPLSDFLREELGRPNLAHLAADPYRVLNIAREYMRLGLYAQALPVLSRKYPDVPPDQSEPGSVLPQQHPLVAYYRAYCMKKLGQPNAAEYAAAAKLSTMYVFPNTAEDLTVLQSTVQAAPTDANAHYLLGTLYFSRELTAKAIPEWRQAQQLNPQMPIVAADIGEALLRVERKYQPALDAFRAGLKSDPSNPHIYVGMEEAMSVTKAPPAELAHVFEQYPDLTKMPTSLVYQFALARAEAGQYNDALALLQSRFFPRQEGAIDVKQVIAEVQLLKITASPCSTNSQKSSTQIDTVATSARSNFLLGQSELKCGDHEQALKHFQSAAASTNPAETVWAWAAAKKLPGYNQQEWKGKLESALARAHTSLTISSYTGHWVYTIGSLEIALGRQQAGEATLKKALVLPDSFMSHHYARLALIGKTPHS